MLSAVSHRSIIWLSLSPYFAQLQSTVVLITILLVTKTENQIPWATAFRYNFVPWNRCYVISIEPQVIRKSSCLCETNVIHHIREGKHPPLDICLCKFGFYSYFFTE